MKFAISSVLALLVASAHAASVPVLHRRIDGCPDNAPWPVGSPGDYWYPVCCPYTLGDPDCCNRHPEEPRHYGDALIKACPGA